MHLWGQARNDVKAGRLRTVGNFPADGKENFHYAVSRIFRLTVRRITAMGKNCLPYQGKKCLTFALKLEELVRHTVIV